MIAILAIALAGCGGTGAARPLFDRPTDAPIMSLRPAATAGLVFGSIQDVEFTFANPTDRAMLILGFRPLKRLDDRISLVGAQYGSVERDERDDIYWHNQHAQQPTMCSFYAGLLLPRESFKMVAKYRPLARLEEFEVDYALAAEPDGVRASLAPWKIYVLDGDQRAFPAAYKPFTVSRWQTVAGAKAGQVGPDATRRAVLITGDLPKAQQAVARIAIDFGRRDFVLEDAARAAAAITGEPPEAMNLAYSTALGGYVVFERDGAWRLTDPRQKSKGVTLPPIPPELLKEVDLHKSARVRIGDKQVGFGPQVRPAGWKFWEAYDVQYGDGMYTHGEFIIINAQSLPGFLQRVRERGVRLGVVFYYFGMQYFTVEASPTSRSD